MWLYEGSLKGTFKFNVKVHLHWVKAKEIFSFIFVAAQYEH